MPICVALLKYGYTNFSLTILDICDQDNLMFREKYFFDVYSPSGPGLEHLYRGRGAEFLTKLSESNSSGIKVEVTDLKTNTTTYHAIRAAARALDIDKRYIEHFIYLKQDKPVFGRYTFKLININNGDKILIKSPEKVQKTSIKVEVTNVDTKEVTIYSSVSGVSPRDRQER